ncbi:MAG: carbonic anhydrase [Microcoleaceae cyanobacterium]
MSPKKPFLQVSRRNLLKLGAGAIGTGLLATALAIKLKPGKAGKAEHPKSNLTPDHAGNAEHPKSNLTPNQALQELMAGNKRFVEAKRTNPHQDMSRIKAVAQSQSPFACILGCADSRVPPEILFDQGIGDLFVVRLAGNIAKIEEIASEEYATGVLGAKVLMVLGHERCGAVKAALEGKSLPGSLNSLVDAIRPAIDKTKGQNGDPLTNAIKENVRMQVATLKKSPIISDLIKGGKVNLVGGYYDLDTGEVSVVS